MIGYVGVANGSGFVNRAISFFSGGPSHSFICCGPVAGYESVLETTYTTIRVAPFDRQYTNTKDTWTVWKVNAPDQDMEDAVASAYYKYTDTWYAYLSYVWYIAWFLLVKIGMKRPTVIARWATPGVHCSELVTRYLISLGGEFEKCFSGIDPNTVTPNDLQILFNDRTDLFTKCDTLSRVEQKV